jgi:Domain of unknown function (DUF5664)
MSKSMAKEFTKDSTDKIATGSIKYDGGKTPVYQGLIDYFPRAIVAVADISGFGASKYAWKGWEGVEDGYNRYSNAMHRHELYKATQGLYDDDSGLLHDAHFAWGALARLELFLREQEKNIDGTN